MSIAIKATAAPQSASDAARAALCDQVELTSNVARSNGQSFADFDWSTLYFKKLVIIGDEHSRSNTDLFIEIGREITESNKSQRICLLLEFPSSISVSNFKKMISEKKGDEETDRYRSCYQAIIEGFTQLGLRPISLIIPERLEKDIDINARDRSMASTINSLFESKSCKHAVFIVGKAHISPDEPRREMLADQLNSNISKTTINAQAANEVVPHPLLSASNRLCPEKA